MIFGNAAWGFRETPLEEQLKITKDMGLTVLELGIANAPNDLPLDGDTDEVVNLYKKYGISLVCAATGNDFSNGNKDDVPKIKKVIDMCSVMGIKYLRIFAGFSPVDEVVGKRWDIMTECICEISEYAKGKNVIPVIETHGGVDSFSDGGVLHYHTTSTKPEILQKLISSLPENVGMNYDPANLYAVGIKNPDEIYQKIKDKVVYLHLKDFVTMPSGHIKPASCGESDMDWMQILKGLSDCDKIALFEYENVDDVKDGCIRCFDYITSCLNKLSLI